MSDGTQVDIRRVYLTAQCLLGSTGLLQFAPAGLSLPVPAQEPTLPATHEHSGLRK
jgi:hypothetical protein